MTNLETQAGDITESIWVKKDTERKHEIEAIPATTLLWIDVVCHFQQIARSNLRTTFKF